jgi:hypothetical protein
MTHIILAALATWRITHLLSSEDGPADIFFRIRAKLGNSVFGRLIDCFYCLSLYVSAAMALFVSAGVVDWTLLWLGLSGAACLLEGVTRPQLIKGEPHHAMLRSEAGELVCAVREP